MSRWSRVLSLAMLLPAAAAAAAAQAAPRMLPLKHKPQPTTGAITAADLMTRLYIFADDSMQGREAGTEGNVKGTDYIAAEAKRMGLIPAGDDGTYFQTIPLKTRAFDTTSTFTVGGATIAAFSGYLPLGGDSLVNAALPVVYGGLLGDTLHEITDAQAAGKLVVFTTPPGFSFGRIRRLGSPLKSAAAVAIAALDSLPPRFLGFLRSPRTFVDDNVQPAPATLLISNAVAAKLFAGSIDSLAVGAAGNTASVALRYVIAPVPFPARNVVGIVRGSDPKLAGEYVAIGGHNDHLGVGRAVDHDSIMIWNHVVRPEGADDGGKQATPEQQAHVDSLLAAYRKAHPGMDRADSIYNGADDDGSGSVSVLEVAQRIATLKVKPKRSLLFVWHVGEEKGLLGSRFFTDHPTVPRDSIVAQLNMDMVGRGDASDETGRTKDGVALHGSPSYLQLVGSRRLSTELGDLVEAVNKSGKHNLTFDYSLDADGHPSNIYCRSDHYEYARYGIPIVFFTTGLHSDYHQVTDEPEYIDYDHMARVVNLVEDVAVHVANLDHRVVVDHPKPDPNGACRQ
ncbi:MAG TPA: M28 family peptidase [Gemmatimonadales bacterium]|nr:M28 family peptidase [Gemmatimonadales bacterium]